jgi:hypothetical protein
MSLVARQNYSNKKGGLPNTFIGGVASSISTPALLATKLAIDVSMITNFSIVGSDIKCKITGSYAIPSFAFNFQQSSIPTYYTDSDFLVTSVGDNAFYATLSMVEREVNFHNAVNIGNSSFSWINSKIFLLKNAATIGNSCFWYKDVPSQIELIYIPSCTSLGSTSSDNSVFGNIKTGAIIYCHPSLATNNAGGEDADIVYARTKSCTIRYVTNFTAPNNVTNLSAGTIYNTAVQLNFTPPTGSTNAIEYYECYANGVFKNRITGTAQFILNLTANTSQNITIVAVDIFYNKSLVSNIVTQSTSNYSYTDTDANASITAKSLTGAEQESEYLLITGLKNNSLYVKTQAVYTFKGTTPSQHKFNSKNPIDTDGAFRLTFSGTGTYSNLGFQTNGSNSYANTYFAPSANQNVNSNGITMVVGTNNSVNTDNCTVGSYNSEAQMSVFTSKGNNTTYYRQSLLNSRGSAIIQTGVNDAKGIWTASKQSSSVGKLFRNQTLIGSGSGGGTLPTHNLYIGALNYIGSLNGVSHQRIQMVILHEGLSNAEITTLHSIIDLSETIAGRKTW